MGPLPFLRLTRKHKVDLKEKEQKRKRDFEGGQEIFGERKRRDSAWGGGTERHSTGRDDWNWGLFQHQYGNLGQWKLPVFYEGDPDENS